MNLFFLKWCLIRCHEWTVEGVGRLKVCAPALLSSLCSSGLPKSRLCVCVCVCERECVSGGSMTPRTPPPPPPPPSLSAEEQRGRKLLVFCAPVLRCRRISFSVQLSNSKDFSVFLSHSSSSSSSSLQLDPSMSARLWGSPPPPPPCACMCRITHHLWNLDPLWFFWEYFPSTLVFSQNFSSFARLRNTYTEHFKQPGLFRANDRVALIRTESFSSARGTSAAVTMESECLRI